MKFTIPVFLFFALVAASIVRPINEGQTPLIAVEESNTDGLLSPSASGNYWLGQISHDGSKSIYDESYKVYRNVLDFGAKGDGIQDDTDAIQKAISSRSFTDHRSRNMLTRSPS
jgi:Pectate lyase superfamily protein